MSLYNERYCYSEKKADLTHVTDVKDELFLVTYIIIAVS